MAEGMEDSRIIDSIVSGGQATFTNADRIRLEAEKEAQLIRELTEKGEKIVGFEDTHMFGDALEGGKFEDF